MLANASTATDWAEAESDGFEFWVLSFGLESADGVDGRVAMNVAVAPTKITAASAAHGHRVRRFPGSAGVPPVWVARASCPWFEITGKMPVPLSSSVFTRATQRRPNDAEVTAAHAQLEWSRGHWGPRAAALVLRSVDLDPENTGPMDANCQILTEMGRFADAEALCQRWLALRPRDLDALLRQSRNLLTWTGDLPGALAIVETTANPGGNRDRVPIAKGAIRAAQRDWAAAVAEFDQRRNTTRTTGGRSGPRGNAVLASLWVARLEAQRGNTARAEECQAEALERAQQYVIDFPELDRGHALVALSRATRGEKNEALAAMDEAMRIAERRRDASQLAIMRRFKADVLTLLGQKEAAIAELRAMHAMGYAHGYRLRVEPEWEPLQAEPKFQQLKKEAEARADAQPRPKK
jgi:tetratricopeptide (TPR) repeat protein